MSDEVELISDGDGVAVIGSASNVEKFLKSVGLLSLSKDLGLAKRASFIRAAATASEGAAQIAQSSGRWVKLTAESAEALKQFGLWDTDTPGIKFAMAGQRGSIKSWLQIETGPGAMLSNPEILSGAAGVMAQVARQQEMSQLVDAIATIDAKLDDVRRHQRDQVLARLDGTAEAMKRATTAHELVGRISDAMWSQVQTASQLIAETQSAALRELDALAARFESQDKMKELVNSATEARHEVAVWLTVLARCFELDDSMDILTLDRVSQENLAELDGHRTALEDVRESRRQAILGATDRLQGRMSVAAATANSQVLNHEGKSKKVLESLQDVAHTVDAFHAPFDVAASEVRLDAKRWRDAARDGEQWKRAGREVAPTVGKALVGAVVLGATLAAKSRQGGKSAD